MPRGRCRKAHLMTKVGMHDDASSSRGSRDFPSNFSSCGGQTPCCSRALPRCMGLPSTLTGRCVAAGCKSCEGLRLKNMQALEVHTAEISSFWPIVHGNTIASRRPGWLPRMEAGGKRFAGRCSSFWRGGLFKC